MRIERHRAAALCALLGLAMLVFGYGLAMRVAPVREWDFHARYAPFVELPGAGGIGEWFLGVASVPVAIGAGALPLLIAAYRRRWDLARAAFVMLAGANLTAQALKTALGATDPLGGEHLRGDPGAFPSGHVTLACSLCLAVVVVSPARWRAPLAPLSASFVAAVGVAVVIDGWHYPSDVMGAFAVTLLWACVGSVLTMRRADTPTYGGELGRIVPWLSAVTAAAVPWGAAAGGAENVGRGFAAALITIGATSILTTSVVTVLFGTATHPPDAQGGRADADAGTVERRRAAIRLARRGLVIIAIAAIVTGGGNSSPVAVAGDVAWYGSDARSRLVEIDFPNDPGRPGTGLPNHDGDQHLGGFDAIDYQGYGEGPNRRITWVRDPLGSGATIARFTVNDGDVATHWGGTRSEIYTLRRDHVAGREAWFTWSWLLGDGRRGAFFKRPRTRGLGFQLWNDGPPPVSIDFAGGRQSLVIRQERLITGPGVESIPIGGYHRGVRQFFLLHVRFADDHTGFVRLWHTIGRPPGPQTPPLVSRVHVRTHHADKAGGPKIGLYLPDGPDDASNFPWTYYIYGYRRADTRAEAMLKWTRPEG